MDPFAALVGALNEAGVRFVVIGVWGANYYAGSGATLFTTLDRDLFVRPDALNLLAAWSVCEAAQLSLGSGDEPLEFPRDENLARRVIDHRAVTRASDGKGLDVDLSPVMAGYDFDAVWNERRIFVVDGVEVPVARLAHIVSSKAATGREKDRLFLEMHREALREMSRPGDD